MKFFTNLWRLLLCALVMVPILYGAWAVFAYFLLRWVETFLISSIPALGFLDPHLVGALVDLASLALVLVARRVLFPFVQPSRWFSSAASSRSTFSGFAQVGFLALWAVLPAAGNLFQYVLERPNADQVFGSTGPRAALCLHKDSHYSLASLDSKIDFSDGAPCSPATPETAAAFQAQRRLQAEAAQNAAQKDTTHSTPETPGPAANQSPAPAPATSPKQPHANPAEKKASVISNIAGWFHPSSASASTIANPGDQPDAKRDATQPPSPAGPYHIQIHNLTGAWLTLHISRSGTVQTFSLGPGEGRDETASRSASIQNYSAETNIGTILKWTQSVDPSKIRDKVDIDLRLPEGYSALYVTNSSGAPIHDIEVNGEAFAMILPADGRTYAAGVYRSSPGTPLHLSVGSPTGIRYTYALTSANQDGHPQASTVIEKLN